MKKYILLIVLVFSFSAIYSQVVKQGERFENVTVIDNKVVFLKEVPLKKNYSKEFNYNLLKDWGKKNYGKDPFISSIRYDNKNFEIAAKSRIELLLPVNSKGVSEKVVMRYRINSFIFQDKCVLEVQNIAFIYQNQSSKERIPKVFSAENFITNEVIDSVGDYQELKVNTRKSALYYVNQLADDFAQVFAD